MWPNRVRRGFDAHTPDADSAAYELIPSQLPGLHDDLDDHVDGDGDPYPNALERSKELPGPRPSAGQRTTLRRVPGFVPLTTYAIALVELAERASYYGVGGVFTNFIQRPLPAGGNGAGAPAKGSESTPGALGMGLQWSTSLSVVFKLLAYTTPLVGGLLADMVWGKFKTIAVGTGIAGAAHVLTVYAALPSLLQSGTAFVPFLIALVSLGGATGLIKTNIAPLMAEQYTPTEDYVSTLPTGETVIVEREATIQKIMSAYFHCINLGAFFAVASTFAEKYVGFWLAYLIPGVIFLVMPPILYWVHPYLVPSPPPSSSTTVDLYRVLRSSVGRKSETPQGAQGAQGAQGTQGGHGGRYLSKEEADTVLSICKLFLFFVIYNIADGGLDPLMTSLAGSMTTNGIPNDFIEKANPLAIVISIPILNRYVYPALRARKIHFGPIKRICVGFTMSALAMVWCALLQSAVYRTSPCGYSATTCEVGTGVSPISAWLVLVTPVLAGVSESFAVVSAMEIAYTLSPPGLKAIVNSLFLFTQALSSALILIFIPIFQDPFLVWPFALIAAATFGAAIAVYRLFGFLDESND